MVYVDQGGNRTTRSIIPNKIEDRNRGVAGFPETYLVAYDLDKDEPRTFRVDRIESLALLEDA
jgi:predicted DNA-binding transcriptional regulator YafY